MIAGAGRVPQRLAARGVSAALERRPDAIVVCSACRATDGVAGRAGVRRGTRQHGTRWLASCPAFAEADGTQAVSDHRRLRSRSRISCSSAMSSAWRRPRAPRPLAPLHELLHGYEQEVADGKGDQNTMTALINRPKSKTYVDRHRPPRRRQPEPGQERLQERGAEGGDQRTERNAARPPTARSTTLPRSRSP